MLVWFDTISGLGPQTITQPPEFVMSNNPCVCARKFMLSTNFMAKFEVKSLDSLPKEYKCVGPSGGAVQQSGVSPKDNAG